MLWRSKFVSVDSCEVPDGAAKFGIVANVSVSCSTVPAASFDDGIARDMTGRR